jgi:hypothetical protein
MHRKLSIFLLSEIGGQRSADELKDDTGRLCLGGHHGFHSTLDSFSRKILLFEIGARFQLSR